MSPIVNRDPGDENDRAVTVETFRMSDEWVAAVEHFRARAVEDLGERLLNAGLQVDLESILFGVVTQESQDELRAALTERLEQELADIV